MLFCFFLCLLQLEEQKFEMERLRRELEEKLAEMTRIKANLQSSEKVSVHLQTKLPNHRLRLLFLKARGPLCLTLMAICFYPPGPPSHSLFCQTSEQVNSSMKALQAEKERLMRSMSEREAELSSLRQAAQAQQSSLQQEQERNSRELGELQGKLQEKVSSREA